MRRSLIYILSCIAIFISGCNKFLDKNPDPTKRVPTSLEEIDYLSNSARNNPITNQASDEYFIPEFRSSFNDEGRYYYKHWKYEYESPWTMNNDLSNWNYRSIQIANASLDLLKTIQRTPSNQLLFDKVKGKCHFLRASGYLYMAWNFCDAYDSATAKNKLGLPIDEDVYFGNTLPRSTLQELYEYILTEADLAYALLEPNYSLRGEVTKTMAQALLARIHLSMRNYDAAFKYSNEAVLQKNELLNYEALLQARVGKTNPFSNYNIEIIEIPSSVTALACDPILSRNDFFMDSTLMASYDVNDLRVPAHFEKFGNYYKHYYTFHRTATGVSEINQLMMADEMWLTRSECNARLGNIEAAMKDLNDLLITRFKTGTYVPYSAASKDAALDIILNERKKTLVLRGLRWIDIKRLNLEGRNISITREVDGTLYTLPANDKHFALPLHSDLVNIYGYKQNPY